MSTATETPAAPGRGTGRPGVPGALQRRLTAALCGVFAAALGLGVGEVVAALIRPESSPVVVVANRVILATPEWLKQAAIRRFGTHDKTALGIGIFVVIALLAAAVGVGALARRWVGPAGMALFGVLGGYCALSTHAAHVSDVVPAVIAAATAAAAITLLIGLLTGRPTWLVPSAREQAGNRSTGTQRRTMLAAILGSGVLAGVTGLGGRRWQHRRFDVAPAKAPVALPPARHPVPALKPSVDLGKSPVPFVTPNRDFYRIDTAYSIPQINPATWQLKITGKVARPTTFTLAQMLAMPLIERWITLMCVSNDVGGNLIGNALFRGVPLAPLLTAIGLDPTADQLVCRSVDGMTIGAPVAQVMDGRDAMLAVAMNGAPLPVAHGFPVRMVVPGLYGYVSACKWINEIEVTTFSAYDAYWVKAGWIAQAPIQLGARIDAPSRSAKLTVGTTVAVAGVAWHQHVGVAKVQVQVDDGPWTDARLGAVPSTDTWRQWVLPWTVPTSGMHRLTVRAFDPNGTAQDTRRRNPFPGASSGLHSISVHAS